MVIGGQNFCSAAGNELCYRSLSDMGFWLSKLGSLIAGTGIVWAVYAATLGTPAVADAIPVATGKIIITPGPIEACGIGILLWLMGKWRSHTVLR
ncbi:MAG: hypothetical protein HYX26_00610 [Acidobacteriales bacterium]|nr:hypothetical protein [Terriglobales bacterium]